MARWGSGHEKMFYAAGATVHTCLAFHQRSVLSKGPVVSTVCDHMALGAAQPRAPCSCRTPVW
eukprot:1143156-Pelagomonas_calceolata.AAC.1